MNDVVRWLGGLLTCIVALFVLSLWPYNTSKTTTSDGLTITDFRRHYPFDIEDGGLGQYLDTEICIDAAQICARSSDLVYSYPTDNLSAPWMDLCDPKTHLQRFFNRVTGKELTCHNCDAEAIRCPKPPQAGTWFDNGNQASELVGYSNENLSTVRTFNYNNDGVTLSQFPNVKGIAYGADSVANKWFYGDNSRFAWIQCDDQKCGYYLVDFNTGQSKQETTPCHYGHQLILVLVGDRPEIRIDAEAKGDEICRDAQGKLAYPLGPEPIILDPLRIDPPAVEPSVAAPLSSPSK